MVLSERLQGLTTSQNFFKKQVAEGAGIPFMTYRRYENGEREPAASGLASLANFFRVSSDYLLGLTDEPTPPSAEEWEMIHAFRKAKAEAAAKQEVKADDEK